MTEACTSITPTDGYDLTSLDRDAEGNVSIRQTDESNRIQTVILSEAMFRSLQEWKYA